MEISIDRDRINPAKVLSHIRKNHAMEHATITLLSEALPHISFSGYSFVKGFWIMGKADLQNVQKAAEMAYARLKNGEKKLAVHPGCGTNIAVTGLCTAAAAMLASLSRSDEDSALERFSTYTAAGMIGALAGRPLGSKVQKYITTDADVSDLLIVSINCSSFRGMPVFFVETALN